MQRIEVDQGSVLNRVVLILTCVATPFGMVAAYTSFKEGLLEIQGDIRVAAGAAG